MASVKGMRSVGVLDCPGGGQVVVSGQFAYVGLMKDGEGTLIADVSDPRSPRTCTVLPTPTGTHSHKVRVANNLMLVNREFLNTERASPEASGGLEIFDVSDPHNPRHIHFWRTAGKGVHRFDFDGRYAYLSATMEGYVGHIVVILDLKNPGRPQEMGRWWMPGQHAAGGEQPNWSHTPHRCHHPLRYQDRLYVSYWHSGFVILDISDMGKPKKVSGLDWSPPFPWPTHTCLPIPFPVGGRRIMLVADEDVSRIGAETPSFLWVVDINDEKHPIPFSSFQVEGENGEERPRFTGCHQPCEIVTGTEIPVAWFAHGLRVVNFSKPHALREVAHYVPDPLAADARVQANDVTIDGKGLMYVTDRLRGLHIVERV